MIRLRFTVSVILFKKVFFCASLKNLHTKLGSATSNMYPDTLDGFGYGFNGEGKLRQIDKETKKLTDKPFDFNVGKSHSKNQEHYEALGDVITDHIYKLLVEPVGMHKIHLPNDIPSADATFIFSTKEKLEKPKKLLILIHGSGVVRAGQWARSLIINHSLDSGTQIPYINKGKDLGFEVLLLNTNDNYRGNKAIKGSRSPSDHAFTVFEKYVLPSDPGSVAIVAHSYGGIVTVDLAQKFPEFFKDKVFAVGFTDSVHSPNMVPDILKKIGRNWVTSSQPLEEPVKISNSDMPRHSAGHTKHEMTSYSCMSALFDFFEQKYSVFRKSDGDVRTDL